MSTLAPDIPETDKPPRRRRWIPLSLRIYVGCTALFATIGAIWFGVGFYRHEAAIRQLERVGGKVSRSSGGPAWFPRWLWNGWAAGPFEEVIQVDLWDCPA